MSYNAGSAFVQIVPSFAGIVDAINSKFTELGEQAGKVFNRALGNATSDASVGPSDEEAGRQGDSAGGSWADGFKARVEAVLQSLPPGNVSLDDAEAETKLAELRAQLEELGNANFGVDLSDTDAQLKLDALSAELDALGIERPTIHVDVDTAEATAELGALSLEADAASGADGTGGGLAGLTEALDDLPGPLSGGTVALAALGTALIPIAGLAAGALSTLPAVLSGIAAGGAAIYLAFDGLTTAIEGTATAFAALTKSGKALVTFIRGTLEPQFDALKTRVQATFLPALEQAATALKPLFGAIGTAIVKAATGIGVFAEHLASMLTQATTLANINTLFTAGAAFLAKMGTAAIVFLTTMIAIGAQATPILTAIGTAIIALVDDFAQWVTSGGFTKFVQWVMANGASVATDLLGIATAVARIVVALAPMGTFILGLIGYIATFISFWTTAWSSAVSAIETAWTTIQVVIGAAWGWITTNVVGPLINFFTVTIPGALATALSFFESLPGEIGGALSSLWGIITGAFGDVGSWVTAHIIGPVVHWFESLPTKISSALSGLASFIEAPFQKAWTVISGIIDDIIGGINSMIRAYNSIPILPNVSTIPTIHRAGGGPVTPGQPYIVGERGSELFIPNAPGTIVPHASLSSLGAFTPPKAAVAVLTPQDRALLQQIAGRPVEVKLTQKTIATSVNEYGRQRRQHGDPKWR